MKRILILSCLLAVSLAVVHAQLPRTFYGATLGITTKHQAIECLLKNNVRILANNEDYLLVKGGVLDDVSFKHMEMHFYDDVLYKVLFDGFVDYGMNSRIFDEKYSARYSQYKYYGVAGRYDDDVTDVFIENGWIAFEDMKLQNCIVRENKQLYREIHPYIETRISQIVLDCTLGVSTKQQVISNMKSQGLNNIPFKSTDGSDVMLFSRVYHEGVYFDNVMVTFFDGKMASIAFVKPETGLSRYDISSLERNIGSGYAAYDRSKELSGIDDFFYDDDRVTISISSEGLIYAYSDLNDKLLRQQKRNMRGKR